MHAKRFFKIFCIALLLNLIWENLHSVLYVHYQGGDITKFILARAALWDAVFTTGSVIFSTVFFKKSSMYYTVPLILMTLSVLIEKWALATARWSYGAEMPIIPLLGTGLTPTIQLALLGIVTLFITQKLSHF